jgi:hypothetical protein
MINVESRYINQQNPIEKSKNYTTYLQSTNFQQRHQEHMLKKGQLLQ